MNPTVVLAQMHQWGRLPLAMGILCLCIAVGGCSKGFGTHRRELMFSKDLPPAKASMTTPTAAVRQASYEAGDAAQPTSPQPRSQEPAPSMGPSVKVEVVEPPEVVPVPQGVSSQQQPGSPGPVKLLPPPSGAGPITLHVDDLDVRKALEILSREAKVNILVSPGVAGKVTIDLRGMTLDEILTAIARLCHLVVRREKDVIYVVTPDELRQGEKDELPVRVYHLNYVKSGDVETMVKPLLSQQGILTSSPQSEQGIKSDSEKAGGNTMAGGEIVVVQDYERVLKTVDRVIAQIDVQPIQVLIEAVIVQVTLKKSMELGVNFALLDGAGEALGVVGNGAAINAAAGFTPASVLAAGGKLANGFAENANGVKFGWVGSNTTAFIRALETVGETKVLASPRLLVLNKQRAEIQLGDRLGYQTATQTQTSTVQQVQFMDVGTLLRLRPFVSSEGLIRMEIHPERSSGALDSAGVPQTHNAQVTSNVMIPDGATIVIGGLIDNEVTKNWEGIPLISRVPVLGNLFRHTKEETTKRELIVILTPHIWRPDCPEAVNYLGRPRSLGLAQRVGQRPHAEAKDGPSLLEIPTPPTRIVEDTPSVWEYIPPLVGPRASSLAR